MAKENWVNVKVARWLLGGHPPHDLRHIVGNLLKERDFWKEHYEELKERIDGVEVDKDGVKE